MYSLGESSESMVPVREEWSARAEKSSQGESPVLRFVCAGTSQGENMMCGLRGVEKLPEHMAPALLVSFPYLTSFLSYPQEQRAYRDWAMDSGAYSAMNSGWHIDLVQYIETAQFLLANDPTLTEVFALDVIGDWRATIKNTEAMWKAGVPAIPAYHHGEPEDVLVGIARDFPKIGLGRGALRDEKAKMDFAREVFARVWPCKIHGFAFAGTKMIMELPWHSVDSLSWASPAMYNRWAAYGGRSLPGVKGQAARDVRVELAHWLKVEKQARQRWRRVWDRYDNKERA